MQDAFRPMPGPISKQREIEITYMYMYIPVYVHVAGFESHLRQLIFSRKKDCLGCAALLCLVCLFDLACFFLSSFSSLI